MAATYEILPDRIAVQFDLNNNPTRWQDKSSFVILYLGILLGLNILLLGALPNFLSKIPDSVINVPLEDILVFKPPEKVKSSC